MARWLKWSDQPQFIDDDEKPLIIGHRGSGLSQIEEGEPPFIGNTATAIQRGIDAKVDWLEIDIRMSKDSHLVVFHDESINHKTDEGGKVADLEYAELEEAKVGIAKEKILELSKVFEDFHSQERQWIFDIKTTGIEKQVTEFLDAQLEKGLSTKQVILFGSYEVMQEYKDSKFARGFTFLWSTPGNAARALFMPGQVLERCKRLGCDYLVLPIIFASDSLIERAKKKDLKVWVYGSDDKGDLVDLSRRGVTGLIVDLPEKAVGHFAN